MKKRLTLILSFIFMFGGLLSLTAQTQRVTGTVVDEYGLPVIGATVTVQGATSGGVVTDIDGNFTLNVPANAQNLEIRFVGMEVSVVPVAPVMNVTLVADSDTTIDIIEVTTGMVNMDKRLFTGATDRLDADNVKLDGVSEISRSLEGRSAGVSVQNVSGTFGAAPKIRVRGATSIYGSSKPLWVVDGIILEDITDVDADALASGDATTLISSAIAGLNADDIESFQILKDGSATSIYGARAMAGVIVVTTKRGKAGVSSINYTGEFTMRLQPSYNNFNIMNSQDQMGVYQEMEEKGWLTLSRVGAGAQSGVYGKMYDQIVSGELLNTQKSRNEYLRRSEYINTNWFKELFNVNVSQNHSVSVSSGNEKSAYYGSLSGMVDPGWYSRSKVKRYTANLNASYNILDNLQLNIITSGSYRQQEAPGTLAQEQEVVTGNVRRDFDINPYSYALNTSRTLDPNEYYTRNYAPFNIHHELDNNFMEINVADLKFQAELKYKPIKKVEISAIGAVKYTTTSQEHHIKDNSNQAQAYRAMGTTVIRDNNTYLYRDPDLTFTQPVTVLPQGGIYQRTDYRLNAYDFRVSANYNDVYNDKHIVNFYAGMELNSAQRRNTWFRGWGLQYDLGEIAFYDYRVFKKGLEDGLDYYTMNNYTNRQVAFFGNGAYSYAGKYTLNGTIRYEGTNRLGKTRSARWLPTWNIAAGWNVHEENFFDNIRHVLSTFSARASYSLTADGGPSSVSNSKAVLASYSPWRPSAGAQESGIQISDLENSELTYEKKHEFNVGFDAGFLNNRFNLALDWYTRNNFDLIGPVFTQGVGGFVTKYGNVAEMKSKGLEISISTVNIRNRNFSWSTTLIYGRQTNEITKLNTNRTLLDKVYGSGFAGVGRPVRALYSIPFAGLNQDGLPTFYDEDGNVTIGGINFQERDNHDFLIYEGPTDPTDTGSFGNLLTWKGFKLNIFITYSFGNVIRLDPVFSATYSDLTAHGKEFRNRWVTAGDENFTNTPTIINAYQYTRNQTDYTRAYNSYNYSTERIAKGDFIRMKEISLSYDFPKEMIKNWKLNSLSLKVQATNPFLIYADKKLNGQDPEFFNSGGVAVPVPKQFTLTVRIGL